LLQIKGLRGKELFLFIFESIGTSELILIGVIALVVFGPRKLPQMAKTIGKTMADFRRTTNDFKSTWEKEVNFEEEKSLLKDDLLLEDPKPVGRNSNLENNSIATPEIREINQSDFNKTLTKEAIEVKSEKIETIKEKTKPEKEETSKRDWL
jgi:Tat protein translocase TatB subunit